MYYSTEDDDRGGAITDFLVLATAELKHTLSNRVSNINLTKDRMSVIGKHDPSHRVHQHLQHGTGTKTCPDNIRYSLTKG